LRFGIVATGFDVAANTTGPSRPPVSIRDMLSRGNVGRIGHRGARLRRPAPSGPPWLRCPG